MLLSSYFHGSDFRVQDVAESKTITVLLFPINSSFHRPINFFIGFYTNITTLKIP